MSVIAEMGLLEMAQVAVILMNVKRITVGAIEMLNV